MNETTTLIIPTHEEEKTIRETYNKIRKYSKKHQSINKIIYVDRNSQDLTKAIIAIQINDEQNPNIILISFKKKTSLEEAISTSQQQTTTKNIIVILNTKRGVERTINKHIKLLRRSDLTSDKNILGIKNYKIKMNNKEGLQQQIRALKKNHRITIIKEK